MRPGEIALTIWTITCSGGGSSSEAAGDGGCLGERGPRFAAGERGAAGECERALLYYAVRARARPHLQSS